MRRRALGILLGALLVPGSVLSAATSAEAAVVHSSATCFSPDFAKRVVMVVDWEKQDANPDMARVLSMQAYVYFWNGMRWLPEVPTPGATAYIDIDNGAVLRTKPFPSSSAGNVLTWVPQTGFSSRSGHRIIAKWRMYPSPQTISCAMSDDYYLP